MSWQDEDADVPIIHIQKRQQQQLGLRKVQKAKVLVPVVSDDTGEVIPFVGRCVREVLTDELAVVESTDVIKYSEVTGSGPTAEEIRARLYPWQQEMLNNLEAGNHVLARVATSCGKTYASTIIIAYLTLRSNTDTALIIMPTEELLMQVWRDINSLNRKKYKHEMAMASFQSKTVSSYDDSRPTPGQIACITADNAREFLSNQLNVKFISKLKYVLCDEVHMHVQRQALNYLKYLPTAREIKLILLSATINNTTLKNLEDEVLDCFANSRLSVIEYKVRNVPLQYLVYTEDGLKPAINPTDPTVLDIANLGYEIPTGTGDVMADRQRNWQLGQRIIASEHKQILAKNMTLAAQTVSCTPENLFNLIQSLKVNTINPRIPGVRRQTGITRAGDRHKDELYPALFFHSNDLAIFEIVRDVLSIINRRKDSKVEKRYHAIMEQETAYERRKKQFLRTGGREENLKPPTDDELAEEESKRNALRELEQILEQYNIEIDKNLMRELEHKEKEKIAKFQRRFKSIEKELNDNLREKIMSNLSDEQKSGMTGAKEHQIIDATRKHLNERLTKWFKDSVEKLRIPGKVKEALQAGIAITVNSLPNWYRRVIFDAIRERRIKVIFADTILSIGVNLPIRTVVTLDPSISPDIFQQMIGRAGRPGYDTMGYALDLAPAEHIMSSFYTKIDEGKIDEEVDIKFSDQDLLLYLMPEELYQYNGETQPPTHFTRDMSLRQETLNNYKSHNSTANDMINAIKAENLHLRADVNRLSGRECTKEDEKIPDLEIIIPRAPVAVKTDVSASAGDERVRRQRRQVKDIRDTKGPSRADIETDWRSGRKASPPRLQRRQSQRRQSQRRQRGQRSQKRQLSRGQRGQRRQSILGKPSTSASTTTGKYVPPHLR